MPASLEQRYEVARANLQRAVNNGDKKAMSRYRSEMERLYKKLSSPAPVLRRRRNPF